jgi:rubrerythrin
MKEQPKMGMNRTGVQMSPLDSHDMTDIAGEMMEETADLPDLSAMNATRTAYIASADPLGSVPLPGTLTGAVSTTASMLTGNMPQLLIDKLGERLAFERSGTRLYEALIAKVQALEQDGRPTLPVDMLMQIRDQEAEHFAMVADAIRGLGADPTAQTPCADLAGVESGGLMHAVTDPRTTVAQSLHAILIAEMADNNGWEMLIALAEDQKHDEMAADFTAALQHERNHLQLVQSWFEEATLGAPMTRKGGAAGAGAGQLH